MNSTTKNVNWRQFLLVTAETVVPFYIATFFMVLFASHSGFQSIGLSVMMVFFYLFMIGFCIKILLKKLPLPALMLLVPIAPLIALIMVVSFIPVLEIFA